MAEQPSPPLGDSFSAWEKAINEKFASPRGNPPEQAKTAQKAGFEQGARDEAVGNRQEVPDELIGGAQDEQDKAKVRRRIPNINLVHAPGGPDLREKIFLHTLAAKVGKWEVFGHKVADLRMGQRILDATKNSYKYALSHKTELAAGAVAGSAARNTIRLAVVSLLAGSGITVGAGLGVGLGVAAVSGATGGMLAGVVKETFFKQESQLKPEEKAFIIAGIKDGYRKIKLAKKRHIIGKAAIKGAAFGFVGGAVGSEILKHVMEIPGVKETLQGVWSPAQNWLGEQVAHLSRPEFKGVVPGGTVPSSGPSAPAFPEPKLPPQDFVNKGQGSGIGKPGGLAPGPDVGQPPPAPAPPAKAGLGAEVPPAAAKPAAAPGQPAVQSVGSAPPMTEAVPPATTHTLETISLPKGSNPWHEIENYLKQSLGGKEPSGSEVQEAVNRFMAENSIKDAHNVRPGTLKVHEVNQYIQELKGGQPVSAPPAVETVANIRAGEVGKNLLIRDEIVDKALGGLSKAQVDSVSFAKGQQAIQQIMEDHANKIHDGIFAKHPGAGLDEIKAAYGQEYSNWLHSEAAQKEMLAAGKEAIKNQLQIEDSLAKNVAAGLKANPSLAHEVVIFKGTTAGDILHLKSVTPLDAPLLGANIAANHDMLTYNWAQVAQHYPNLQADVNFPVSLSEINQLVADAQNGDQEALRRLIRALHWIPAGGRFKLILGNGAIREVLRLAAGNQLAQTDLKLAA